MVYFLPDIYHCASDTTGTYLSACLYYVTQLRFMYSRKIVAECDNMYYKYDLKNHSRISIAMLSHKQLQTSYLRVTTKGLY